MIFYSLEIIREILKTVYKMMFTKTDQPSHHKKEKN